MFISGLTEDPDHCFVLTRDSGEGEHRVTLFLVEAIEGVCGEEWFPLRVIRHHGMKVWCGLNKQEAGLMAIKVAKAKEAISVVKVPKSAVQS